MAYSHSSKLFLSVLLLLPFSSSTSAARRRGSNDISIFHNPSPPPSRSHSELDAVLASAVKDPARLSFLSSAPVNGPKLKPATRVPVASGLPLMQTNDYVLRAKLGTPSQLLFLALDTGADSAWLPCSGCSGCPATNASFSPTVSSSYATLDCSSSLCPAFKGLSCAAGGTPSSCAFNMTYGGDTSFAAILSQDSLRLGPDVIPNYPFGCVNTAAAGNSMPKQGLLGLGRGPNGLLAQSGALYQGVFSYCLPSYKSYFFSGSLRLGPIGQPKTIKTTPLLLNPHRSSLYYVNLTGVSVGKVPVAIPADSLNFDPQTGAGTVVDSGTVITRFVAPAYATIRDEFRRQVNASEYSSLGAFDTCFETSADGPVTPGVTLHMAGLDLALPVENTLIHSAARPLACLAMAAAPDNVNNVVNVIANYQQQNLRVMIDVANSKVGFARELCG